MSMLAAVRVFRSWAPTVQRSHESYAAMRACAARRTMRHLSSALELDHEARPQELVLNVSGPDRVGVVHDVARRVVGIGGNIGESQAITVKGTFIAAFAISVDIRADPQEFCKEVTNALPDFAVSLQEAVTMPESAHTVHFVVSMADSIGVVHDVCGCFAEQELSVVSLKTTRDTALGGKEIFGMQGTLSSEKAIDVEPLSDALERIERSRGIDVELYVNPPGPAPQELFPFRHNAVAGDDRGWAEKSNRTSGGGDRSRSGLR